MTLGQIIKKLRSKNGITQEKLAEYLGVSAQAVSRWECDTAMPDISLLPPIANLFDITTNYLLGVDIAKKEERIREICKRANIESYKNVPERWKNATNIIREGLKLYPNSWLL